MCHTRVSRPIGGELGADMHLVDVLTLFPYDFSSGSLRLMQTWSFQPLPSPSPILAAYIKFWLREANQTVMRGPYAASQGQGRQ